MDSFVNQLKKFICDLHAHYPWSIILLGIECSNMVAFNALTSGHMNLWLNRLKKLICDLRTQYSLPIILYGIECTEMVEFNALTSGHMDSCLNELNNIHLWSSWTISLTNDTVGRWMYVNGSIQRSNIRTYQLVLKSAKKLICDLHTQYPLPIILLGVAWTKMVAFNARISGHMDWCLNQLNNSHAIFTHNISYQYYCLALNVRKW